MGSLLVSVVWDSRSGAPLKQLVPAPYGRISWLQVSILSSPSSMIGTMLNTPPFLNILTIWSACSG